MFSELMDCITATGTDIEFVRSDREMFFPVVCGRFECEVSISVSKYGRIVRFAIRPKFRVLFSRSVAVSEFCLTANRNLEFARFEFDAHCGVISVRVAERIDDGNYNRALLRGIGEISRVLKTHIVPLTGAIGFRKPVFVS